jgi:hypothetical protein
MPNRQFIAIWLVLFSIPLLFLIVFPLMTSIGMDFNQTVIDPYKYEDTLDLRVPISMYMQWGVQFEIQGYSRGYHLVPQFYSFTNWSASTSIGEFRCNLSLYLNREEIYHWVNIFTVPNDSTGWGSVGFIDPPESDLNTMIEFSTLEAAQNNLTITNYLTSKINSPGEANMVIELGPLILEITSPLGLDFIPNAVQPLPDMFTYPLIFICGIVFLPGAEIIRVYGNRLLQHMKS